MTEDVSDAPPAADDSRPPGPAATLDDPDFSPAGGDEPGPHDRAQIPLQVGRFPILRRLGSGGMGAVYAAYDELLDRKVALKVMHPQRTGSLGASRKQRTLVEARALARLSHPNIPLVFEVGEAHQQVYISMEFIDGETLADWCSSAPRSWQDILSMYLQAGEGLHAAHQAGIVHRDFKPNNVLVGRDGRPRVVDFGLARLGTQSSASLRIPLSLSGQYGRAPEAAVVDPTRAAAHPAAAPRAEGSPGSAANPETAGTMAATALSAQWVPTLTGSAEAEPLSLAGKVSGTPGYMSPEQYIGGDVDSLSDQFSFCAALFEALYGYPPFSGESVEELARAVHGPVRLPPPHSKVPAEVQRALLRGLAVEPQRRFSSMGELLTALRTELVAGAGSGALSRMRVLRLFWGLTLVLGTLVSLRFMTGNVAARDGALGSLILIGVLGGAGLLRFQTLLENRFHRRIYLALLLIMAENLGQRLLGWKLGWMMRQLVPFEMVVWAGGTALLSLLGLRGLQWMTPFLFGMSALLMLSNQVPRPLMLVSYIAIVAGISITWSRTGDPAPPPRPTGTGT